MSKIEKIFAREILDSRGNPTVEVDVTLKTGAFGRASVPSGASTGKYEAVELRDGEERYHGKGVTKAIKNVNFEIAKTLTGNNYDQNSVDETMIALDGTENKGRLGANAILGVSMAFARACAQEAKIPLYRYFGSIGKTGQPMCLPVPMMNILNGGKHAENSTDFQEFMIMPIGAKSFSEALRCGSEIFHSLKKILSDKGFDTSVGDEGGFAPELENNEAALKLIIRSVEKAGYELEKDVVIAIDVAASEIYNDGKYNLKTENRKLDNQQMIDFYSSWIEKYPIVSIEDGLEEDDWNGYVQMTKQLGKDIQIVGDDLFVTNTARFKDGIEKGVANSILIKLNQIGTVTETIRAINMANEAGYTSIVSHRSGETEDSTIADFVVGLGTGQIKTGSLSRSERICKYNQLLRIEEQLGESAIYLGKKALK